jgi:hypothetical protein
MIKFFLPVLVVVLSAINVSGQATNAPLDPDYYHLIQRYEIKSGSFAPGFHSNVKPYLRSDIAEYVDTLYQEDLIDSRVDDFNLQYLANDNWEFSESDQNDSKKPLFKALYRKQSDLFYVDSKDFDLHVSPVFHFGYGIDKGEDNIFTNSRGLVIRGMISKKVGFYTYLVENQMRFPSYVRAWMNDDRYVVPGEGFWKDFKDNGVDFFTARGYISFDAAKFINFQFGHDKQFIGNGYRSLILSDFSNNHLFLKINTNVWRLHYSFMISEMRADAPGNIGGSFSSVDFPKKYMAFHRLGINITDQLNLGVFESVIFGQHEDSVGTSFELDYLNPIIFYRAIEQSGGSQDNALLGADITWNFLKRFSLYGQLVFDEFLLEEVQSGDGWWGNKFSYQMGLKYIDVFGINNLDLQLEGNFSRPYTYAHETNYTSYSHYKQALAHPLGANFKEFVALAHYQPHPRLRLSAKLITAKYGADTDSTNWGADILKSYNTREMDFNNEIGQGVSTDLFYFDFTASYQLRHNLFIEFNQVFRNLKSEIPARNLDNTVSSFSIRLNIPRREHVF